MHTVYFCRGLPAPTKRLPTFWGNQKSRARGGRTLRTVEAAEMGRGSTFIFIWPCNATTLQQTWLYHLTLGLLDTHVSLFRRLVFDNSLSITIQYKGISTDRADNILDCQRYTFPLITIMISNVSKTDQCGTEPWAKLFFRCLHDNPSGQKIPPAIYCYTHEAKESFFGAAVKKDDHSRHGGFITLKPPCARRLASRRWPVCPSSRVASASWTTWQPGKPTLNRIAFPVGELGRSLRMSAISLTTSIHGPPGLYTSARKRPA